MRNAEFRSVGSVVGGYLPVTNSVCCSEDLIEKSEVEMGLVFEFAFVGEVLLVEIVAGRVVNVDEDPRQAGGAKILEVLRQPLGV